MQAKTVAISLTLWYNGIKHQSKEIRIKSKAPVIDRDTYRSIKKMSREELQAFLVRYANELANSSPSIDLREVEKDIRAVKGIGEKRAEEIMRIFERHLGVAEETGIDTEYTESAKCKKD